MLAKRHDGKFPYEYVSDVLRFGTRFVAHGSTKYEGSIPCVLLIFSLLYGLLVSEELHVREALAPCRETPIQT
jgi:hypothetical protein